MSTVVQCDQCKKVIEQFSKPIKIHIDIEHDGNNFYNQALDVCSKECFKLSLDTIVTLVQKARF